MATSIAPPYRAKHARFVPHTHASERSPVRNAHSLRYLHNGFTPSVHQYIGEVREWQVQQFANARSQGLEESFFTTEPPRNERNWLGRAKWELQRAHAMKEAIRAREKAQRHAANKSERREEKLREEQQRAQFDGQRRGVYARAEEECNRRRTHETLVERAKRMREEGHVHSGERCTFCRARVAEERRVREARERKKKESGRNPDGETSGTGEHPETGGVRPAPTGEEPGGTKSGKNQYVVEVPDEGPQAVNPGKKDGNLMDNISPVRPTRPSAPKGDRDVARSEVEGKRHFTPKVNFDWLPSKEKVTEVPIVDEEMLQRIDLAQQTAMILRQPVPTPEEIFRVERGFYEGLFEQIAGLTMESFRYRERGYQAWLIKKVEEDPRADNVVRSIIYYDDCQERSEDRRFRVLMDDRDLWLEILSKIERFEDSEFAKSILDDLRVALKFGQKEYNTRAEDIVATAQSVNQELAKLEDTFFELRSEWLGARKLIEAAFTMAWRAMKGKWEAGRRTEEDMQKATAEIQETMEKQFKEAELEKNEKSMKSMRNKLAEHEKWWSDLAKRVTTEYGSDDDL